MITLLLPLAFAEEAAPAASAEASGPTADAPAPAAETPTSASDAPAPVADPLPPSDAAAPATPGDAPDDDEEEPPRPGKWSTTGELRLLGSLPPELVLDNEGHTLGQTFALDSRLRAGLGYGRDDWKLVTEWDLFTGQLAGDPWDVRGSEDARDREVVGVIRGDSFRARKLAASGVAGPVGIEAGLVTSHWGLGLLANDGAHDPYFGRADFGDRVLRLRLATRPWKGKPLAIVVAGDRVIDDELASWSPLTGGQAAWQAIASALWAPTAGPKGGIYAVYRHQTESDGARVTEAGVVDLYGDLPVPLGAIDLRFAAEGAGIFGHTTRAFSYNARDGLDVVSFGVTGLAELKTRALPLTATLRGGYASGDGNPDDDLSQDFGFDRDFDVGMVMFDEVQGAIDAATYAQLTDEAHSGGAPYGAETLVGEGAFRHATFVQPVVAVEPLSWLEVKAGAVFAWNTSPIAQPYATYRNGGVPANHLGTPTTGYALGTELDWAVTVGDVETRVLRAPLSPALLVQGGHYLASADMGGGVHTLVTATGRVRW